jgi:hypothetical protein
VYRKAILKAIEDLHDCQLRSNVDAIRRHVMSTLTLETDHSWNEVIFLKTLKVVVGEGEIEQMTNNNCALSPEYKRRRSNSLTAYVMEQQQHQQQQFFPNGIVAPDMPPTSIVVTRSSPPDDSPKSPPKRKVEHDKYKIMPKPLIRYVL